MTLIWRMVRALCCGDGVESRWLTVVDCHAECCHQGIDGQLFDPQFSDRTAGVGKVVGRKRFDGLLSYYHRPAA